MCRCSISPFRMTCMFVKPALLSSTHKSPFHIRLPMIGLLQVRHIQYVGHSVPIIQYSIATALGRGDQDFATPCTMILSRNFRSLGAICTWAVPEIILASVRPIRGRRGSYRFAYVHE